MSSKQSPDSSSHVRPSSVLEIQFGNDQNSDWTFDFKPRAASSLLTEPQGGSSCEVMQVSPSGTTKVFGSGIRLSSGEYADNWRKETSLTRSTQHESPRIGPTFWQKLPSNSKSDVSVEDNETSKASSPSPGRVLVTDPDRSAESSVSAHEASVVREICKQINCIGVKPRHYGRVYAIRDTVNKLVKIGSTMDEEAKRLNAWIKRCSYPPGQLELLAETAKLNISTQDYKRLERLIHVDLQPHRRFFNCECGGRKSEPRSVRHKEWFEVSDEVVLETIKVWHGFIQQEPYVAPTTTTRGYLKPEWEEHLRGRTRVDSKETHVDHDIRIARWQSLFASPAAPELSSGENSQYEAELPVMVRPNSDGNSNDLVIVKQDADVEISTPFGTSSKTPSQIHEPNAKPEPLYQGVAPTIKKEYFPGTLVPPAFDGLVVTKPHSDSKSGPSPITQTDSIHERSSWWTGFQRHAGAAANVKGSSPTLRRRRRVLFPNRSASVAWKEVTVNVSDSSNPNLNLASQSIEPGAGLTSDDSPTRLASISCDTPSRLRLPQRNRASKLEGESCNVAEASLEATPTDSQSSSSRARLGLPTKTWFEQTFISLLSALHKYLSRERTVTITGLVYEDIRTLKWPLLCSVVLALQAPFSPPILSWPLWMILLPLFVRELRCWA